MRKEVLFAIVAGGLVGLIIAFGVWRANKAISSKPAEKIAVEATPEEQATATPKPETGLVIASPEDQTVIVETPVTISGLSRSNSIIAILGEEKDYVIQNESNGEFKVDLDLVPGVNQIKIISFDKDGQKTEKNLNLVYSSEFSKTSATGSPPPSPAVTGADSVREKVKEKVEEKLKNPKAYIGTITDITATTVQIRSSAGEIQQVSVDKDLTTFIEIDKNKVSKEVKFTDLAIGDFIVAMGYKNGNEVLAARRVIITPVIKLTERTAVYGTVLTNAKNKITTKNTGSQNVTTIEPDNPVNITEDANATVVKIKLTRISEGNVIVAIGTTTGTSFLARRIHVLSPTPNP
ncbi:hypothetical protein A2627_03455 [Candidatus Woesebacteria bacterium RIFCSPHIGHO2_01_FULL_39_28]|uniref:DUF5666 domain-containing protein n=1 Tax=Candidatus Woesebacteria bacterium RIFCSPHIGHO2_01_FULL_39_28 TaxID=1802496 RepID=A0A1F7YB75_9BACT|nr:MAG: hypothetical protein A2627_03455 [Candidatus Woesebacteria bacterium RIFCSPHIGHO2_01_FULL_39_28]OGM57495.1 MAG: hypothetical protein A3A50_00265 [Candidatus Woesebacteria bacterium RIFCSPLOWO2_01_FULL_38_20]